MNDIKVSVFCLVYNHEIFLRQCLDGFVNQKCDFKYEVLIHDDASTDNSANIIREYEEKYPEIIKPIYQTENQYSKGVKISKTYQYPRAKGEYLAWCEGDDYWTDPLKLQKQVDFLDNHPDYSACVHRATCNYIVENIEYFIPNITEDRDYTADEVIALGGGVFCTNSFMIKKETFFQKPSCFDAKGFGDYQLFMYATMAGKLRCLADNMSVYNCGINGSWTDRVWKDKEKRKSFYVEMVRMLKEVDKHYDEKYHESINKKIDACEFDILIIEKKFKEAKQEKYKEYWNKYKKSRFKNWVVKSFPFLKTIKRKLIRNK